MNAHRTRSLRRLTLLAGTVMLSATACWPQTGGNAANQNTNATETAITPETVSSLAPVWTAPGATDAVWGNQVVGADRTGVRSRHAATGAQQWSYLMDDPVGTGYLSPRVGATIVGDDVLASYTWGVYSPHGVICGGQDFRFDLATGTHQAAPSGAPAAAIVPFGDHVATYEQPYIYPGAPGLPQVRCEFGTPTGVAVVDAATGETQWTGAVGNRPVVIDDQLFNSSGATLRSYVASGCGAPTCEPVWSVQAPAPLTTLAAEGDRLYAITAPAGDSRELLAFDRSDGSVEWSAVLPAGTGAGSMTIAAGRVHVATDATLATFDRDGCGADTCAPLWTGTLSSRASGNLASGGGVVYVAAGNSVHAFDATGCDAAACDPLTTLTTDGTPTRIIVDGGMLFVTAYSIAAGHTTTAFAPA